MVMGGVSCSEGCGFASQHCILEGHFSHLFDVKICDVCLKRLFCKTIYSFHEMGQKEYRKQIITYF